MVATHIRNNCILFIFFKVSQWKFIRVPKRLKNNDCESSIVRIGIARHKLCDKPFRFKLHI